MVSRKLGLLRRKLLPVYGPFSARRVGVGCMLNVSYMSIMSTMFFAVPQSEHPQRRKDVDSSTRFRVLKV